MGLPVVILDEGVETREEERTRADETDGSVSAGVDVSLAAEVSSPVSVSVAVTVTVEVEAPAPTTVDVTPGTVRTGLISSVIVDVRTIVDPSTPPSPTHVLPTSQHPYSPLSPSEQYVPSGHPPAPLGQHVSVRSMQKAPHVFWPSSEHGIWVWRRERSGVWLEPRTAAVSRDERRREASMLTLMWMWMCGDG